MLRMRSARRFRDAGCCCANQVTLAAAAAAATQPAGFKHMLQLCSGQEEDFTPQWPANNG